jgi:hypothetical protein
VKELSLLTNVVKGVVREVGVLAEKYRFGAVPSVVAERGEVGRGIEVGFELVEFSISFSCCVAEAHSRLGELAVCNKPTTGADGVPNIVDGVGLFGRMFG